MATRRRVRLKPLEYSAVRFEGDVTDPDIVALGLPHYHRLNDNCDCLVLMEGDKVRGSVAEPGDWLFLTDHGYQCVTDDEMHFAFDFIDEGVQSQ